MKVEPVSTAYKAAYHFVRSVPRPVADAAALAGSVVAAEVSKERRLLVERNLRRVYGDDFGGRDLRRCVVATFASYARYWVDSFRLPGVSLGTLDAGFQYRGFDHLVEARERGIGPIIVLPHLGGWEWAGFWLTRVMEIPVTVVVEPLEPRELFDFFVRFRQALGMNIVTLGPAAGAEVLRAIKERHVVCLLADRDIHGDGVAVDFFGERTTLPAGPVTLALRTGAPLHPTAVYFAGHRHVGVVRPALPLERQGRFRADVVRGTQRLARELEDLIRVAPEQWHLQQPNWPSDHEALEAIGKSAARPGRSVPHW
ncbi:phosphatidylinositol mannoside acyltransferase [Rhabdothermincola sediminis]|uniref:phosphatidylinositol mannoside acyltransferase n=1 Tax=Rhabdothermincola sediminis TaxID=2751370 RepID=UPI001AA01D96|nr:phosphatidylinositol mannoside acyltransferase [Rhabdothermincola sediminis]